MGLPPYPEKLEPVVKEVVAPSAAVTTEVERLITLLNESLAQTLRQMNALVDADLDQHSDHPCSMGGSVRDLLTHNIDHERMHVGQVYSARYGLKKMQKGQVARLMAETLRARADLMAALAGLPDEALGAKLPDEDWTVREMIEHTIYWERHSMADLATQLGQPSVIGVPIAVTDPLSGPLSAPVTGD